MIQVLLLILKIIGILLAVVLGLLLLVILLVLFVPVFYKVRVIHNKEKTEVRGKVTFLYPLLSIKLRYLKKFRYKVRVLGFSFLDSEKEKKEKKRKKHKKHKEKNDVERKVLERKDLKQNNVLPETTNESVNEPVREPVKDHDEKKNEKETNQKSGQGFFAGLRLKIRKIRDTIGTIINKIKKLLHQKEEVQRILAKPESKSAISFVWGKIKRLVRHILPRKIKGYLNYGSSDPATTGKVLGIVSVLFAKTGQLFELRPNFQEEQLECDLEFCGHIQLFTLLIIVLKIVMNKEVQQMIQELKNIKEIE